MLEVVWVREVKRKREVWGNVERGTGMESPSQKVYKCSKWGYIGLKEFKYIKTLKHLAVFCLRKPH